MKRLTFDGNFCDIAMCQNTECEDGDCSSKRVWERLKAVEKVLGDDYDLEHLRELVKAEKDGRAVVLPFDVGTKLYSAFNIGTLEHTVRRFSFQRTNCNPEMTVYAHTDYGMVDVGEIGKIFYLTREEAEAELGGEER